MEERPKRGLMTPEFMLSVVGMSLTIFGGVLVFQKDSSEDVAKLRDRISTVEAKAAAIDNHLAYTDGRLDRLEDKVDRAGRR